MRVFLRVWAERAGEELARLAFTRDFRRAAAAVAPLMPNVDGADYYGDTFRAVRALARVVGWLRLALVLAVTLAGELRLRLAAALAGSVVEIVRQHVAGGADRQQALARADAISGVAIAMLRRRGCTDAEIFDEQEPDPPEASALKREAN